MPRDEAAHRSDRAVRSFLRLASTTPPSLGRAPNEGLKGSSMTIMRERPMNDRRRAACLMSKVHATQITRRSVWIRGRMACSSKGRLQYETKRASAAAQRQDRTARLADHAMRRRAEDEAIRDTFALDAHDDEVDMLIRNNLEDFLVRAPFHDSFLRP